MKYTGMMCLVLVLTSLAIGQYRDDEGYSKQDIEAKITSFKNMRVSGLTMLGLGVASLVTGIALASGADWETQSYMGGTSITTDDPQGGAGLICIVAGVPFTIVGTVLSIVGSNKVIHYKNRLRLYGGYSLRTSALKAGLTFQL